MSRVAALRSRPGFRRLAGVAILAFASIGLANGALGGTVPSSVAPASASASAAASVSASDAAAIQSRILELEHEIGAAIGRGDAQVADRLWSDAYQYVGSDGRVYDKAQRLALTKPPAAGTPATIGSVDEVRVRVIDANVAVALVWTTWRTTVDGQERVMRFVASHVWVREAAGWRLNTAQVAPAK